MVVQIWRRRRDSTSAAAEATSRLWSAPGTPFTTARVRIPTGVLPNNKTCRKGRLCYLANDCYFDKNTHIVQFRNTDIVFPFWF